MFDQARDARISRQIVENHDLKVFGPTASGSQDLLYHGVFYYYLIGPAYTIFNGNPYFVTILLGLILSFTTISSYLFAKHFTKDTSIAIIVAAFAATSISSVTATAWLSNPMLLFVTIPLFYYYLYRFIEKPTFISCVGAIVLAGLCTQFSLFSAYLWLVLAIVFVVAIKNKQLRLSIGQAGIILLMFLGVMGSMIVAEAIQIKAGLLTFSNVGLSTATYDITQAVFTVQSTVLRHINESFIPILPLISVIVGLTGLYFSYKYSNHKRRVFIFLLCLGPLVFLSIQARTSYHTLLGYQPVILTLILYGFWKRIPKLYLKYYSIIGILIVFSQITQLISYKKNGDLLYPLQKGISLGGQLNLIDQTYVKANGKPFSISTFANPYLYNITWDYLYDWYGKDKYGYVPQFKGSDQSGQYGITLIKTDEFMPIHFAIVEPDTGLDEKKSQELFPEHAIYPNATPSASTSFGSLKLIEFIK